jgi:tetratricopeptide (TPR) repeat protein
MYGSAAAVLNSVVGGDNSSGHARVSSVNSASASPSGSLSAANAAPDDITPLLKEKLDEAGNPIPIDPRVTVLTVGKMANKFFADAQQKERAGKYKEAELLYMRAIRLRNRFWGDNDPAVLSMYMIVGKLEMKQSRPEGAEPFFKRALQICLKRYGFGSYENVDYLAALGDSLFEQNKFSDACNYYKQVRQLQERKFGAGSERSLASTIKLANAMAHQSDENLVDAQALLELAMPLLEKFPDNKSLVITGLQTYQFVLNRQGKSAEAAAIAARLDDLCGTKPAPVAAEPSGGKVQPPVAPNPAAKDASNSAEAKSEKAAVSEPEKNDRAHATKSEDGKSTSAESAAAKPASKSPASVSSKGAVVETGKSAPASKTAQGHGAQQQEKSQAK